MTRTRWGPAALVALTAVVLQVGVLDVVRPLGLRVDLPLLLLLGVGFALPRADAAVLGWLTGLLVDLHQLTPLGLTAVVYAVAGWSLADSRVRVVEGGVVLRATHAAVAAVGVTAVLWVAGVLLEQDVVAAGVPLLRWVVASAVVGALGVHPATAVGRWLRRDQQLASRAAPQRTRPA